MDFESSIVSTSFEEITAYLTMHTPFAFTRWGDGEWAAVLGVDGENCDGHRYFKRLGKELDNCLKSAGKNGPWFMYGLLPIAVGAYGDQIQGHFKDVEKPPQWINGNLIMRANRRGRLASFAEALDSHKIMYVAPGRLLHRLPQLINIDVGVHVPLKNAYVLKRDVKKEIIVNIVEKGITLVGFSAGMMSGTIINDLWEYFGTKVTFIDFGSMWDGYWGWNTRKYHADFKWGKVRKRNFDN